MEEKCDCEESKEEIDFDSIKTYPAMNASIVGLLKMRNTDQICMYAAKRIEEMFEELWRYKNTIQDTIDNLKRVEVGQENE